MILHHGTGPRKSNLVVALGGRVFQAFIFLQGVAWHRALVPDLHAISLLNLTLLLALSQ